MEPKNFSSDDRPSMFPSFLRSCCFAVKIATAKQQTACSSIFRLEQAAKHWWLLTPITHSQWLVTLQLLQTVTIVRSCFDKKK
jgi:hypothetical protein